VFFGEVGLTGALRPVAQSAARLKEAAKLGFNAAALPRAGLESAGEPPLRLDVLGDVADLVARVASGQVPSRRRTGGDA
jgi:DNA repair protein RadA/Sms